MTVVFALFLVVHGVIHVLGFAKAFGLAPLPQLTRAVSGTVGVLWLTAALLFVATAVCLFVWPRWWWAVGAGAILVSFVAIIPSWTDAKFGAVANAIVLAGVIFGFLANGPFSLQAGYNRDVDRGLERTTTETQVTESDLTRLPEPVQRYLRASGAVGQPRVRNLRARMHGRFRSGPDARWMPFTAEQFNFFDAPARLFYMKASLFAIPFQGYHRYVGPSASMRITLAALVSVIDLSGDEMTRGETVTMFNDMCVMAPGTLIEPAIRWQPVNSHAAEATFVNAGHTVHAALAFNDRFELVNFQSDDRYQTSPDGRSAKRMPWSTPLGSYRSFGPVRLTSRGDARWHEPEREYAYIELEFDEVQYNVSSR
jgi:hypothetical protein